jgi:hypothetical protein
MAVEMCMVVAGVERAGQFHHFMSFTLTDGVSRTASSVLVSQSFRSRFAEPLLQTQQMTPGQPQQLRRLACCTPPF